MIELAAAEGWNPGLHDDNTFFHANSQGLFCGHLNGQPIGFCSAMIYDHWFAFFGLYMVLPEFRRKGFGISMTQHRLNYVGNRTIGLDGVPENIIMYSKMGFRPFYRHLRYEMKSRPDIPELDYPAPAEIIELDQVKHHQLQAFDTLYFPACRSSFLDIWTRQQEAIALAAVYKGELAGYILVRPCQKGCKVGPLLANHQHIAGQLLLAALQKPHRWPLIMDIPEPNIKALQLAATLDMTENAEFMRMYNRPARATDITGIYGQATMELG